MAKYTIKKTYLKLGIVKTAEFKDVESALEFMREDLRGSDYGSYDAAQAFDDGEPLKVWEIEYTLIVDKKARK